jgi:RHS repeat-associated protein
LARTLGYNSRLQLSSYQDALQNAPTSILFSVSANWGAANNNGSLQSETLYEGGPGTLNSLTQLNRSYGYDPINRVSAASDSGGWSRTFCYDRNGNLWVTGNSGVTLAGNTPQQLGGPCPSSTTPYNGNNQISGANYDAAGNQTVVNGNTLGYDAENRVASALDSVTQSTETYLYDGDGQRVEKSGPAGTTVYVYDVQGRLAAEYSTASSTSPCTTCYLSADQLGSTRLVTDFSGSVVGRHDYLPFGEEVSPNTLDNISQKFTGQMRDAETGMDFFHARYFGAALGRFTSPDPGNAGADITNPQSWNAYAYVLGNPLALVDPSGLNAFGNGGDDGGDPCFEDPFLCGVFPPIFFPTPEPSAPPPPPTVTESTSSGPPLPPGSFPGGETLGLPPGMTIPGPLSWQVLLGLWEWDCAGGVCVPGLVFAADQALLNEIRANRLRQENGYLSYAACLVFAAGPKAIVTSALGVGGTAALGKSFSERFPLPPGIVRKVPERVATTGLKWGTKGSYVGAGIFVATFEVELYNGAKACSETAGYTPWVFEP